MNSKLYVGNLSFETLEIDLQDLFAQVGTVTETMLMQDRATGQSRGFAFVTMSTGEEAQEAIRKFDGQDFQGRALRVNESRPKEEGNRFRSGGGGGGGGGGGQRRDFQRR
jgi:RNA recognition motif-containing protein